MVLIRENYSFSPTIALQASRKNGQSDSVASKVHKGVVRMTKQTAKWFEGINITLPFVTVKFKRPTNNTTESGKMNNLS